MALISDEQLVAGYLKGNEKLLKILIQRYLKPIFSFAYRYTRSTQDAEDIAQEVFVKVWRNLKKFDQEKSFKTWIFTIAKNTSIDFLRKKKAVFSSYDTEKLVDTSLLPDESFDKTIRIEKLNSALLKLPLKSRIILYLHYTTILIFAKLLKYWMSH